AKSLRGEKMEDVIFNGSDARKAGGAAEVRLRLSGLPAPPKGETPAPQIAGLKEFHPSPDYGGVAVALAEPEVGVEQTPQAVVDQAVQEMATVFTRDVEVTRRLYRSGESEYLIDGEVCRLKDVHELLMDTGLGAKAY